MAKLYVAYGSNLNKEQMRYRCPAAKFVGTGIIEGYELQFKGALHGACATIAPKEGTAVPVGIWTIQRADEKRLDIYEGYHEHGHSFCFQSRRMKSIVHFCGCGGIEQGNIGYFKSESRFEPAEQAGVG